MGCADRSAISADSDVLFTSKASAVEIDMCSAAHGYIIREDSGAVRIVVRRSAIFAVIFTFQHVELILPFIYLFLIVCNALFEECDPVSGGRCIGITICVLVIIFFRGYNGEGINREAC